MVDRAVILVDGGDCCDLAGCSRNMMNMLTKPPCDSPICVPPLPDSHLQMFLRSTIYGTHAEVLTGNCSTLNRIADLAP